MLTGNRGEWSEVYVLLKLLGDGEIYGGDGDLNRVPSMRLPIIKINRKEFNKKKKINREHNYTINTSTVAVHDEYGTFLKSISRTEFKKQTSLLLRRISTAKGSSFSSTDTESFINKIYCSQLKAKSSDKADIQIGIHDIKTALESILGFSIKSKLGAAPTLINASSTTNFRFKITNLILSTKEIEDINNAHATMRNKVKELVKFIYTKGGKLTFEKVENPIFDCNLTLVDSRLPELLAEILLEYYSTNKSKVIQLVDTIKAANNLKYDVKYNHDFYAYKIKKLFAEVALGMQPSKVWHGIHHANGGYIIVKNDGDVLCYNAYNRNTLEDYLFANTKLETASTSKHGFGKLFEEDGNIYLLLNLQVRFI